MASGIGLGLEVGARALRVGWYLALKQALDWQTSGLAAKPRRRPTRPVPPEAAILAALRELQLRDATAVAEGLMPPLSDGEGALERLSRARALMADVAGAFGRREAGETGSARSSGASAGLPDYYTQDFHFQTGGYLTDHSARLYDIQVETLFLGGAQPMRREALRPIAEFMRGRDQRKVALLDVACGTGRLLRDIRRAWPAMALSGLDLSRSYLDEARRHLGDRRPAHLVAANAEAMPISDASQDIVTSVFLFHELPPDVRRRVAAEMARVLKPDGLLVFIDSLQMGDRPGWDGLIEAFPERFHEPYYRHYASDDLDALFAAAGLPARSAWTSFFAKVMVRVKPA